MLFTSNIFFLLLGVTLICYYLVQRKGLQVSILILSSLIFYGKYNPQLVVLLILSVVLNTLTSWYSGIGSLKSRRISVTLGVILNLLVLAFFKYAGLLVLTFHGTGELSPVEQFMSTIPLPVGISFFTFQGMSLLIDVYRNPRHLEDWSQHNFWQYLQECTLFKVFFPQLVAGPIVKAHDFMPQIGVKYFKDVRWEFAIRNLIMGYFLKMVVADNLKDITSYMIYPRFMDCSSIELIMLIGAYSMQIFADFAGYSTIAIGLSRLFGYELMVNFNFPYIATSFSDFWRRWHISLSSWLREYLYFSLGGNKTGTARTYINLMIVMTLGGLWHGAAWSYMVWGTAHGLFLVGERMLSNSRQSFLKNNWYVRAKTFWVFLCITLAWLLFRLPDFSQVIAYLQVILFNWNTPPQLRQFWGYIFIFGVPVLLYHFYGLMPRSDKPLWIERWRPVGLAIMLVLILIAGGSKGSFIYFRF
jgi:alginate O-acetyltransferase complex protein AlgI